MCKTRKKIIKKNLMNLFDSTGYIYIFCGLTIARAKEKKKKKSEIFFFCAGDWMGYYPFSSLSHDTMDCIVTQGAGACSRGPRHG